MTSSKPKLFYFPIQGRAEPIRLALAAAGVEFENVSVDRAEMKADTEHYPFGQVPRYVDDEVDMVQSMGILRHVARKHGLYGQSAAEQARVEEVIEGVQDLRGRLLVDCMFKIKDNPGAKDEYWQARIDPASAGAATAQGAHMSFLDGLLGRSESGYFVESGLTVADILLAVNMHMHLAIWDKESVQQKWPRLVALHDRVLALPRIAEYLASPLHPAVMHPLLTNLKS